MWEKFGTSGKGTGVGSSVVVGVDASTVTIAGVDVGRGNGITVDGEGVDAKRAVAGWQAEVRKETRRIIHNRRLNNFISISFFTDYKSKIQMY
jgi:hypothetical protein